MDTRAHPNRVFTNVRVLRRATESLIVQGRYRIESHARTEHPEFSDPERLAVVQWGGRDQPDKHRDPSEGVYVCWAVLPRHGLCRAVYAVEQTPRGDMVVVITVMPE